jgi:hypothetical protein
MGRPRSPARLRLRGDWEQLKGVWGRPPTARELADLQGKTPHEVHLLAQREGLRLTPRGKGGRPEKLQEPGSLAETIRRRAREMFGTHP